MKFRHLFAIVILSGYAFSENTKVNFAKIYNVKDILGKSSSKFFLKTVSHIKKNFKYKYVKFYQKSLRIVVCFDVESHFQIYQQLLDSEERSNSVKLKEKRLYFKTNNIFYSIPENRRKKRKDIASLIIHKNNSVSYGTIQKLIQTQEDASFEFSHHFYYFSYRLLVVQGTDHKNYICLIRIYTPMDSTGGETYCRITCFSTIGNLCNDSFFSIEPSFYYLSECIVLKRDNVQKLQITVRYFLYKSVKKTYGVLVNKHGFLFAKIGE